MEITKTAAIFWLGAIGGIIALFITTIAGNFGYISGFSLFWPPLPVVVAGVVLALVAMGLSSCGWSRLSYCPWCSLFFFFFLVFSLIFSASGSCLTWLALSWLCSWEAAPDFYYALFGWPRELIPIFRSLFSLRHHWSRWVFLWMQALALALLALLTRLS